MKTNIHLEDNRPALSGFYLLIVILFLTICPSVFAVEANEQWVARYSNPDVADDDEASCLSVDNSGNVYVTGHSVGNGSAWDYATIKYSPDGNELWVKRYNGPDNDEDSPSRLILDDSGNVYVTGYSFGCGGTCCAYLTIKYSPDGNQLWATRYDGQLESENRAADIASDSWGNIYVTGFGSGSESGTYDDYATIKYSPDGNQLWAARYNGPGNDDDDAVSIAIDHSGNVCVTGYSSGSGTNKDYATIKYTPDGNQLWVARYNGPANDDDYATSIAVDNSDNIYVTGWSIASGTIEDYTTIKYSPDGNQLWVARYDGPGNSSDWPYDLAVDSSSNVYVTGYSYGSTTYYDYATVKYNSDGNQLWAARYNGAGNDDDVAYKLVLDNSGNTYVTGYSDNGSSASDYTTIKYGPDGNQLWVVHYNGPAGEYDHASFLDIDDLGNVYVTGFSYGGSTYNDYATIKYEQPYYNNHRYVDANATGANDGSSWENAYKYLQDALWTTGQNCEIWVAQGTYRPDKDTNNPSGTNDQNTPFYLISGISIYGGFPSGGGTWSSRDPNTYQTILSGDIGISDNNSDNSYHVVMAYPDVNSAAILDGFTITGGNDDFLGMGGGMYIDEYSSPTVTNCTFSYNSAATWGGGMFVTMDSNPILTNCTFIGNSSDWGGGIYFDSGSIPLTNCTFNGNTADYGGGIYIYHGSITLTDCNFTGNSATYYGDGLYSHVNVVNLEPGTSTFIGDEFYSDAASQVKGTGSIIIELGGEMIVDSNAAVDLSDPCDPDTRGTIHCDGLLQVKQNAILRNTDVNVSRQAGGYFGKFEVQDNASATNLNIYSDGDRFMDVNYATFTGTIANNRIYVTITEGQNGSAGGVLEARGLDVRTPACDFNDPNVLACWIDSNDMPDFNTVSWTLERLEVRAGAKVTLMDRFSSGNGDPEVLYVKELVLGTGSIVNVGTERLYYSNLSGDLNSIQREAQMGFSLGPIDCDTNEEFLNRVGNNNYTDPYDPNQNRVYIERITGLEPDPNGMMKMSNFEDSNGNMISARAKAEFAPACEEQIRIQFDYLFNTSDPCAQIVVYLSDVPELLAPDDPCRDTHYIEVARISPPSSPLPGSAGSSRFGNFDMYVSTGTLDLANGTYVELELIVEGGRFILEGRGPVHSTDEQNPNVFVDNLNTKVSCNSCSYCLDLDSSCSVEPADFLKVVRWTGGSDSPTCMEGFFSNDGYTDSYDTISWDWTLKDTERQDRCGEVPLSNENKGLAAGGLRQFGDVGVFLNLNDLNDLLVSGKRGSDNNDIKMKDRLYVFHSDGNYIQCRDPAPKDRCNIRIVRGTGDNFYQINSEDGVTRLDTGDAVVPPGQISFTGYEPRYTQPATVYAGIQRILIDDEPFFFGRPILDAAFDASYVYVVPVVVVPNGNTPYEAAAKIQLNTCQVVKLYDGPVYANDNQLPYRNSLREIELDSAGNVYVTNGNKINACDILWKFEPNDATPHRLELDPCDPCSPRVRAPTGMCVSSTKNMLYIASALSGETDPDTTIVRGFSTATLSLARSITIHGMQHVTSIAEDPATNSLWIAGFNLNPDPQSSTFYDPYLAEAPLGFNEVNAVCVEANDLAMPLSICWTGALPAQELCGGADLTGNGTVNIPDFAKLALYWRSTNCAALNNCEGADLEPMESPDGDVDLEDLDVFAEYWLDTGCIGP